MTERTETAPTEPSPPPSTDTSIANSDTLPSPAPASAVPSSLLLPGQAPPVSLDTLPEAERNRLQLLVRGGTTSSAYDKELQQRMADAEVRRAEADADRKVAQVPIEQGGGLLFENKLADPLTGPRVLIKYVGKTKEVLMEQLCELVADELTGDHMLIFVCPECFRRGVPSQFAQCHVRSKHRQWHLDLREAGQVKAARNSDSIGGIEYYTHAGNIMDTDVLRCDGVNCGCSFKIDKNIMYRVG